MNGLKTGAALAYSQALWVSTDGIAAPFMTNLTVADELATFMERRNSIPASCFLYRADSLPDRAAWPEDVESAADWILWRRIISENSSQPIFYCRVPIILHFSAKRMASRYARMPEFATALEVADRANWWPSPLRVSVPAGKTEQDVYAGLMRADPQGWSGRIRSSTADLISRLAWEDIQMVRPSMAQLEERLSTMQSELAEMWDCASSAENKLTRAEGDALEAQSANQKLCEMLAEANERIDVQSHEIEAMRSTAAWKLHMLLQRVPSMLRR
ncbi:hypothetical protein LJR235_004524 [Pararhizobium sp. LjRoot235]